MDDPGPGGFEKGRLLGGRSLSAGRDGPRVAHAPAGRGGQPGDVGDDGLGIAVPEERPSLLLGRAADLADENDGLCLRVLFE